MRVKQREDARGSLYWMRQLVYQHSDYLALHLSASGALPSGMAVTWMSPRADDEHAEYRDQQALDLLAGPSLRRPLQDFWPLRGPQWDALGKFGKCGAILVEAKANIREFASRPSGAKGSSLQLIVQSCAEVKQVLGVPNKASWTGKYYQYANRLALWQFMRDNGMDAHLVFLYFMHEPHTVGPTSESAWRVAIRVAHATLGLPENLPTDVHELFIDVRELQ